MRNLGILLLAIWLILTGIIPLLGLNFPQSGLLLAILAIAAGVFLLVEARGGWVRGRGGNRRDWYAGNLGFLLLGIYLILVGILPFLRITAPGLNMILAVLAIAAGLLLLLRRA
jgi:hypothetical protein